MNIKIKGSFEFLKWDEAEVSNFTSTGNVKYKFICENDFTGKASYVFYYLEYNKNLPLESHSYYTGYIACKIIIKDVETTLIIKDDGEFKNGGANSKLTVINNNIYSGSGSYLASYESTMFELNLSYF